MKIWGCLEQYLVIVQLLETLLPRGQMSLGTNRTNHPARRESAHMRRSFPLDHLSPDL